MPTLPSGLYVITDGHLTPTASLLQQVTRAIDGGAVMVQYREKRLPRDDRQRQAAALVSLCRARGLPLIVNDDAELALAVGAHGVHLGRDDSSLPSARKLLGPDAIIGVSCYNRLERARQAADLGASYVAFGRFFPSSTKPDAVPVSLDMLIRARAEIDLPIAAIGGITPANGGQLVQAGADLLAVIHGVFGQADTRVAAQAYAALFNTA